MSKSKTGEDSARSKSNLVSAQSSASVFYEQIVYVIYILIL